MSVWCIVIARDAVLRPVVHFAGRLGSRWVFVLRSMEVAVSERQALKVLLATPRGFCAGVQRAVDTLNFLVKNFPSPIYVFHEIIHNESVVRSFQSRGVVFVDDLASVPSGSVLVFSAHGVGGAVVEVAKDRGMRIIDATCPLVEKVHAEVRRFHAAGRRVILIGHRGHDEVQGTSGQVPGGVNVVSTAGEAARLKLEGPVGYVTQTTLSAADVAEVVEVLKSRFPDIAGPPGGDVCYATENRQRAVRSLCPLVDVVLVVGSSASSNANRLREVACEQGRAAYLLSDGRGLRTEWLTGAKIVGVTASASTPDGSVMDLLNALGRFAAIEISALDARRENVRFAMPRFAG